jgi:CRP-like cAMP-binding protein
VAVFGNRLLDVLPREEAARLAPHLRRVFLHRGQELGQAAEPFDHLIFPVDALLWAWMDTTDTERPTSLLTVGRRGVVGMGKILDMPMQNANLVVLSPGSAWRLHASALDLNDSVRLPLRRVLSRFVYGAFAASCCRLACNSEHNVDKRLARWLLWIVDETGKPEVSLTHQQIADVAAIRRPSVSLAFSDLQRRGIVRVHHGLVQILDRERLERETCPCYYAIRDIVDRATVPRSIGPASAQ